tara:strand:+ start:448 stop:822 length:375 start_codon:yes stop_codon:yes gene_type:complete
MLVKEKIEDLFLPFLQNEIKFILNNRTIKQGRLLLVSHKGPYISFFMIPKTTNTPKSYDIPFPFEMYKDDDQQQICVCFNYTFNSLSKGKLQTINCMEELITGKTNRFLNGQLKIVTNNIVDKT